MQQAGAFEAESDLRARAARLSHASALSSASTITVSQLLWTRALPGSVAVLAVLSLPELSLGAGAPYDAPASLGQARAPAFAAARPAAITPKLAPLRAEPLPAGLREPLAPATEVSASEPVVAVAEPALLLPEARPEPQAGLAAERAPQIAPPVLVTAPAPPVAALALAVPAALPLAEPVPPDSAPAKAAEAALAKAPMPEIQETSAVVAASAPGAFGGARESFGGLAPSAATASDAALAGNNVVIAKASAPAGLGDATPDRRPALAPLAPPSPLALPSAPVAAPAAVAPIPAPSAPASSIAAAGPSEPVAAARPAALQSPSLVAAAPIATAAPARPAVPVPAAAPVSPKAPALAASAVQVAPRPKPAAPVTAAVAPARAAASPTVVKTSTAAAPASAPAPAAALAPLPQVKPEQAAPGAGKPAAYAIDVRSQLTTRVDGKMAGKVDFQQTASGLQVRLGSIVELLGDRYEPAQIERIRASSASELYLPLAQLQAQGIPISYDPVYDEFNVGLVDTRPKAARKVHMDQISAPERGLGSTGIDQLPRR